MILNHFTKWPKGQINPNESYETNWVESTYWIQKKANRELGTEMSEVLNGLGQLLKAMGKDFDLSFFQTKYSSLSTMQSY